jgi:IS1 family transposase
MRRPVVLRAEDRPMTEAHWLLLLVLLLLVGLPGAWHRRRSRPAAVNVSASGPRSLKPRTPEDCPACRHQPAGTSVAPGHPDVRPWRELKSRRGAPKRIATQGFACPAPACAYFRVTDDQIHALVGDGIHGKTDRIQTFRCQACGTTFSARRDTPLYRLKTPAVRVGQVLTALAEGLDIAAAGRVFGHRPATITTWLARAGAHSATLHARWFRDLRLPHLQLDEIRTRLRRRAHVVWLWVAVEPRSKIVPVLHLGARTQASAHALIHALRQALAPGCLPVFTSDGLRLYFYALTAHFGQWAGGTGRRRRRWQVAPGFLYGQITKTYRRRRLVRVTPVPRCGTREELSRALAALEWSGRLNTAFVERVNLTLRRSVAALGRRTWATAQRTPHLIAHLEWWRAYYHFVRPHRSLRVALTRPMPDCASRRYRQRTPAMAAGLTRHRWTARDVLTLPLPGAPGGTT